MSSELLLDYGPLGYPVPPEYATSFFPGFKGQSRADHLPVGCHVVYPGLSSYKQEPSSHARSLLPYTKCSPYYPLFGAMIDAQPSAFRPHKPSVKSSFDPPTNTNHAATTLYYNNRRVCTCNLAFTTPRTPPKHPICTPPKHPICTPEYYSWIFPSNGPYPNDDIPIGLRLSSLTTRPFPIISRRHEENEKRPAPKRFQCPHCEKSFGKSSHLRDHVRTHTGDRPYRCEYCDKAFTQYSNLRTHTRIHTGERPYRCSHCSKSFTQAVTLRSHTRTHLGEKAYHCKQCSKSFACFSGLKGHIRVHETSQASTHAQEDISPDVKVTLNIKQEVMDDVLTENQN